MVTGLLTPIRVRVISFRDLDRTEGRYLNNALAANVAGRPGCGQVHESVDDPDDSYREKCSRNGENGNRLRGAFVCCPQYLLRILSIV